MSNLSLQSTVKLLSGLGLPQLGFGVALSSDTVAAVTAALEAGYRHIDSARRYGNEAEVLQAVKAFNDSHPSERVFVTTKVTSEGGEHAPGACEAAVADSIAKASAVGLTWDLFLLHDPNAGPEGRLSAYRVLLDAQKEGKVHAVGVSNFGVAHLEQLAKAGLPPPDVNQVELHPWNQQRDITAYCHQQGIAVLAFCPLVRSRRFEDPTLAAVAAECGKSPAQVLVRWSLQKGFVPLPKSDTPSRIKDNADVFDFQLSARQMDRLDGLDQGREGACSWNPVDAE